MKLRQFLLFVLAGISGVWISQAQATPKTLAPSGFARRAHVDVQIMSETSSAEPGGLFEVGFYFQMEKGWHIYWKNPGDSGEPPKFDLSFSQAASGGAPTPAIIDEIEWPSPQRIATPPLMQYGYAEAILLPLRVRLPEAISDGLWTINARVRWLVCHESCIPGEAKLVLPLAVKKKKASRGEQASFFDEARLKIPKKQLRQDWQVTVLGNDQEFELKIQSNGLVFSRPPIFFPSDAEIIENAATQRFFQVEPGLAVLKIKRSEQLKQVPAQLRGVLDTEQGIYNISPSIAPRVATSENPFSFLSWIHAIFFAFLGGLILNLMPCVFPVLSIKALSILNLASSGESSRARLKREGLIYTSGILISLWAFALITLVLRAGGAQLGWGFQLQSPFFIGTLALLIFLMALNLLGVFEVNLGGLSGVGGRYAQVQGPMGALLSGMLAVVVATPCTAPFMGSALGFTLGQPAVVVISVFTFLGLGLAAPYVLLSFFPVLKKFLPRPGRWMESLKQFLAFPLLGTVVWLIWIYGLETSLERELYLWTALLFAGLAGWIWGRWQNSRVSLWVFVLLIVLGVGMILVGSQAGATQNHETLHWEKYSKARLQVLLQEKRRVFVDFTAAWCVTCKVNEQIALERAEVMEKFKSLDVVLLRGDWTDGDPEITQTLGQFGRNGVPLYLLYSGSRGDNPVVLPQILTASGVLQVLDNELK